MIPFHHMLTAQSILLISSNPAESVQKHFHISIPNTNPDIFWAESEKSIGIDSIREIQQYARKLPFSEKKCIVIPYFDTATVEAQNALLKLLEEPPDYLQIILTAENQHLLLETILSRCAVINDIKSESIVSEDILGTIVNMSAIERINIIPTGSKSKAEAMIWVRKLLGCARNRYGKSPSRGTLQQLKNIASCLESLDKNANPTIALCDMLLSL